MFHEFGHTLHGLFANQNYTSLSGTATTLLNFLLKLMSAALDPEVLKNYAIHYKTKEVIPQDLIDKIKKAETFNKGYDVTELLAASTLDMNWHSVENEANFKPALVLKTKRLKIWTLSKRSAYKIPHLFCIFGVVDILQDITLILGRKH
jgi:peptidyl-dipeptidase Dcp